MISVRERAGRLFDFLKKRRLAYMLTFAKRDKTKRVKKWLPGWMRRAYRHIFIGNYASQEVLIDLATFCRGNQTTFHTDPRISAVLQGRHEVWLRITNHLHLTSEQLFALYNGNQFEASSRNLSNEGEDDDA